MGMKRAAVWQIDPKFRTATHDTPWVAEVLNDAEALPRFALRQAVLSIIFPDEREFFPTHAEAIAWADGRVYEHEPMEAP